MKQKSIYYVGCPWWVKQIRVSLTASADGAGGTVDSTQLSASLPFGTVAFRASADAAADRFWFDAAWS
jgi:hypothetical protein